MLESYHILAPNEQKVPILVSVPHCGLAFPPELQRHYKQELVSEPDDTDFYINVLYDFVSEMGITMIYAHYSRWVIDLNRSPDKQALYSDGRILTELTPTTDFLGNSIYISSDLEPDAKEIERRKDMYFKPYYIKTSEILNDLKSKFGIAFLWDAHSIRHTVPTIQESPFPDLVLGTNDGQSADDSLIQVAKKALSADRYELSYNNPFKGGNITRYFGKPQNGIHALQLEMVKMLYMDDQELNYHSERANNVRRVLKNTFKELITAIQGNHVEK